MWRNEISRVKIQRHDARPRPCLIDDIMRLFLLVTHFFATLPTPPVRAFLIELALPSLPLLIPMTIGHISIRWIQLGLGCVDSGLCVIFSFLFPFLFYEPILEFWLTTFMYCLIHT